MVSFDFSWAEGWGVAKYIKWSQNKITLASTLLLTLQISASVDTFWKQEKYLEIQKPSFNTIYSMWFKNSTLVLWLTTKDFKLKNMSHIGYNGAKDPP